MSMVVPAPYMSMVGGGLGGIGLLGAAGYGYGAA
jgi:hypothetical protein